MDIVKSFLNPVVAHAVGFCILRESIFSFFFCPNKKTPDRGKPTSLLCPCAGG
jgi:hypothetical protein